MAVFYTALLQLAVASLIFVALMMSPCMKQGLKQMPEIFTKQGAWEDDLRRQIKREHGAGWSLYPQSQGTEPSSPADMKTGKNPA